jgi:eukaryotic-like serine/threonine-protein kinase
MADSAPLLAPGVVIAETYEIDRQIGRGGMGEVWLARHTRLAGKQVAIKVLHVQGNVTPEALARFRREAEIAARLEHPNIVQVLDFNALPTGEPFLVMELLKGTSLADRLKTGPMPLELVQQIVRQAGSALQTAHRAGVVHRDLKPENIYLTPTALGDQVKVLDFGISKLADSKTIQTTDSVLIGTPLYMSPEQATGANSEVTLQSDLFSLGSICYELLTGEAPFSADSVARVVFRIAYEQHVPLQQLRPDLPSSVTDAVEHALVKDRHARTRDIDAFVMEFTGVPLGRATDEAVSGVYQAGMQVTDSLMGGKTQNAGASSGAMRATPAVASSRPATPVPLVSQAPVPPKPVSGRALAIGLVVAGLLIPIGVLGVRRYWMTLPTQAVDAGVASVEVDAGPPPTPDAAVEPVDAGVAVPVAAVVDAGAPRVERPDADPPPSAEELAMVETFRELAKRDDWETIENRRGKVESLRSRKAREQGLLILIDALCHRSANQLLSRTMRSLRETAPKAVAGAKARCLAIYPEAAHTDW